ncbi:MAG: 16S rRNA (uracil(1498)-N(3))-methyltransferase [Desulfobacterales bacterium]|nr:16S rRNA (uracil(1498)-N(3))-methyltransferase [Desulfobacterales bacterium]
MRYFYIDPSRIDGATAVITGPDARHISRVLRLKPGDEIGLFDGAGSAYEARVAALSPTGVHVSIQRAHPAPGESPLRLTAAQALLKDRKMDGLIRQLTELGISRWLPFISERSIPRPNRKRLATRRERWVKIAREALKQCKRGRTPIVGPVHTFEETLAIPGPDDLKILCWEKETRPIHAALFPASGKRVDRVFALLGPEGGFTPREVEKAREREFIPVSLGPRVLRAETAALAVCALLQHLFGDMGPRIPGDG